MEWVPRYYTRYYEPYFGAGSFLFSLKPRNAIINDTNEELINVYKVIQSNPDELIKELQSQSPDQNYLYKLQSQFQNGAFNDLPLIKRASGTILLYRINELNQDKPTYTEESNTAGDQVDYLNLTDEENIWAIHRYLNENSVKFLHTDFEKALEGVTKNAFIYFNPPRIMENSKPEGYPLVDQVFSLQDHQKLKELIDQLDRRKIRFILSLAANQEMLELYRNYQIRQIRQSSPQTLVSFTPRELTTLLIRNYN